MPKKLRAPLKAMASKLGFTECFIVDDTAGLCLHLSPALQERGAVAMPRDTAPLCKALDDLGLRYDLPQMFHATPPLVIVRNVREPLAETPQPESDKAAPGETPNEATPTTDEPTEAPATL